jgi:hypothetical protein
LAANRETATTVHNILEPAATFVCVPRYRWRTALRSKLPWILVNRGVAAKGRKDCGEHEWYNHDDAEDHCYHCTVGVRRPIGFCRSESPSD